MKTQHPNRFATLALVVLSLSGITAQADSEILSNELNGHWYQRVDDTQGWHGAKSACEKRGGYLATVTSGEESDFIARNFIKEGKNPGGIWLGATNEGADTWHWVTGEEWTYNNWNEGEPNNSPGTIKNGSEHYLVMGHFQDKSRWNDINTYSNGLLIDNTFYKVSFVCEWEDERLVDGYDR